MICRDRGLELHSRRCLANFIDTINGATAIPDEHFTVAIEGDAGSDPQFAGEGSDLVERTYSINGAVKAAGDEHLAGSVECDARWIGDVTGAFAQLSIRTNAKQRNGNLFASRT